MAHNLPLQHEAHNYGHWGGEAEGDNNAVYFYE